MKLFCLIIVIAACTAICSEARLGESRKACRTRYGDPIEEKETNDSVLCRYKKSDLLIQIEFSRRKSFLTKGRYHAEAIQYWKPSDNDGQNVRLTDREVQTLLDANAKKQKWHELDMHVEAARITDLDQQIRMLRDSDIFTVWKREDGARAVLNSKERTLRLSTPKRAGNKTLESDSDLTGF